MFAVKQLKKTDAGEIVSTLHGNAVWYNNEFNYLLIRMIVMPHLQVQPLNKSVKIPYSTSRMQDHHTTAAPVLVIVC